MMNHPGMTSRGRMLAGLFALTIAFLLPKHVDCGYPGADCGRSGMFKQVCTPYEVEPLGFFLLESAFGRDIGFAYKAGEKCR